jgi:hypothetical protein
VIADGKQSIYRADCPNLGCSTFGAKVAMDNRSGFDAPDRALTARHRSSQLRE